MFWSVATVLCYTASSLGDKFISAKLRCSSAEFAFLVGLSTAVFLALVVPFMGWRFAFTWQTCAAVAGLTLLKLAEFYTSAILLRQVSAYELKAWLSLNVLFSFLVDLARGEAVFFPAFVLCAVVMLIGSFVMMFVTNAVMAVAAIVASLLGFVVMFLIMGKSQKFFARQQRYLGDINGHIEETYAGHNVVKAYNAEHMVKKTFNDINYKLYTSAWKSQFFSGLMMPLMTFVGNLGYVAVCVTGAVLVANGSILFGTVIAFTLYVRLFTSPLSQLAQSFTSMQTAAAASERVFEFLEEDQLSDESGKTAYLDPAKVRGDVTFEHVHFGYDPEKIIINDFSAEAKAGQKVAIVGPTGAGKTTMVNLLMRFYELNSGCIRIDGIPTSDLTRENVHDLFCMVLQDTWLFEGTIRENVVYSKENVTDEDVVRACKAVGLHHFIRTLPKGYDTVLDDKANLSAGQKQLVTIARAMIENAPMLILDEATSSVDTRTEVLIQQAMDKLTRGRTSFIIAHRLSTIRNADLILVMKDGGIIEKGTHEQLLAKNGFYADLYNSQFESA